MAGSFRLDGFGMRMEILKVLTTLRLVGLNKAMVAIAKDLY